MSGRVTFRGICSDVAWQKQLRDRYLAEGTPSVPHLDLKRAEARKVSRHLAEQIILKYEWLGTLPPGCTYHYGLFFGLYCAGVTCTSVANGGANLWAWKELGLRSANELAYLARGACVHWAPRGSNSKLVSLTCRLLAKETQARVVLAYSDTDAGEIGTIYQACNWVCLGRGDTVDEWVAPNGRTYNQMLPRNLSDTRGGSAQTWRGRLKKEGWKVQQSNPKWRYVYLLDKSDPALLARIERMRVPYPKRVSSVASDTPAPQVGEGGATPTETLFTASEK